MPIEQLNITSSVDDRNIKDIQYDVQSKVSFVSTSLRGSAIAASQKRNLVFSLSIISTEQNNLSIIDL